MFALIIHKLFLKTNKINIYITNQEICFGGHFLSFVAFVFFCMSKKSFVTLNLSCIILKNQPAVQAAGQTLPR